MAQAHALLNNSSSSSNVYSPSTTTQASFFQQYAHLFFIDLDVYLCTNRDLADFEKNEPGYTKAIINAYLMAFSTEPFVLNFELIKKIHQAAMQHLPSQEDEGKPGTLKNMCNNFKIRMGNGNKFAVNPSGTIEGVKEFIERWILDSKAVHGIDITLDVGLFSYGLVWKVPENSQKCLTFAIVNLDKAKNPISVNKWSEYDHKKDFGKIRSILSNYGSECEIIINAMINLQEYSLQEVKEIYDQKMHFIIDHYHQAIKMSKTVDEKMLAIIDFVQSYIQLHYFCDGNTRTGYVLLNALLHSEGLPLALLINPNRLECFDRATLLTIVKQGQGYFNEFLGFKVPTPDQDSRFTKIKDRLYAIKPYSISGCDQELTAFIRQVLQKNLLRTYLSLAAKSLLFFLSPEKAIDQVEIVDIDEQKKETMILSLKLAKPDQRHKLYELYHRLSDLHLADITLTPGLRPSYKINKKWLDEMIKCNSESLAGLIEILNLESVENLRSKLKPMKKSFTG